MSGPIGRPRIAYRHGNSAGYNWDKCRCDECRAWNRDRVRAATKAANVEGPEHGSVSMMILAELARAEEELAEADDARDTQRAILRSAEARMFDTFASILQATLGRSQEVTITRTETSTTLTVRDVETTREGYRERNRKYARQRYREKKSITP